MLKRLLFIGLCLCLAALITTDASARCRVVDGHWKCTDLCPITEGTGAGNVDVNTVEVCVALAIVDASIDYCENPGGNAIPPIGLGVPFSPITMTAGTTQVTSQDLTGVRGQFEVDFSYNPEELCFSWEDDIWPPIIAQLSDHCPNDGWTPMGVKINTMYGYHAAYQEDGTLLVRSSGLCVECVYDPNGDVCTDVNPFKCTVLKKTDKCEEYDLDFRCDTYVNQ